MIDETSPVAILSAEDVNSSAVSEKHVHYATPPVFIDSAALTHLDAMSRDLAIMKDRRARIVAREAVIMNEVAESKGRKLLKEEVDEGLLALQRRVHERSVGSFEKMLTAITDDVIPNPTGGSSIKLDLHVKRDMPALDIYHDNGGKREAITSGAMLNVVGTGLRFISLARSGMRRFMVLDEADCWIEDGNTRDFFSVINQLSRDANIQTLIITHHATEVMDFAEDFRIYHVDTVESNDPWPARSLRLLSQGNMWVDEGQEDHFSWLEATNFEGYQKARMEFAPGVTVIVGPNRHGKSAFTRAFRAAFSGDGTEQVIRHGAQSAKLAFGMSDGRVHEFNRFRKGNPIANYILHSESSWAAQDLEKVPALHNNPGASVPDWVDKELGMGTIDGIDVQLWDQGNPVFMLNQPASKRASLLSIGRESGFLYAMNELYKADVKEDTDKVNKGEREITAGRVLLQSTEAVDALLEGVDRLRLAATKINEEAVEILATQKEWEHIEKCENLLNALQQEQKIMEHIPYVPALLATGEMEQWISQYAEATQAASVKFDVPMPSVMSVAPTTAMEEFVSQYDHALKSSAIRMEADIPTVYKVEETALLSDVLDAINANTTLITRSESLPSIPGILRAVPTEEMQTWLREYASATEAGNRTVDVPIPIVPLVQKTDAMASLLKELAAAGQMIADGEAQLKKIETEMTRLEQITERAAEALGEKCPVCQSQMTVDDILGKSAHRHTRISP